MESSPMNRVARAALPLMFGVGLGTSALAQSILVSDTIAIQPTNWNGILTVPRFDPTSGILDRIEISLAVQGQGMIRLENTDTASTLPNASLAAIVQVIRPGGGVLLEGLAAPALPSIGLGPFDGTIDFGGSSGFSSGALHFDATDDVVLHVGDPLFAQFVGTGTLSFPAQAQGAASGGGAGNIVLNFSSHAGAILQVRYVLAADCNMNGIADSVEIANGLADCDGDGVPDVCEIPPDCNLNGIPDECEPDCDFDGIPDVCEPDCDTDGDPDDCERDCNHNDVPDDCDIAAGTSADKDMNGIPDECGLCVPFNRRVPGSLLLFPEFDNRTGVLTLLTVTNTSCVFTGDLAADSVDVEYVYIDREGCAEFNRIERLTPCDTLSVLTGAHDPDMEQGYVYVFARRHPAGVPISFNHLIGQLLVLDSLQGFEYAANAVSFRSPRPRGLTTELDANGLRDLDDREYEPAPDQILVPRFLGQCDPLAMQAPAGSPRCVRSRLILIDLTGGASFLTTVDFLIHNDNEQVFSAEYSFRCWDDPLLLEISGAFAQTFLAGTADAPDEILGAPQLESGWIRINGALTDSTVVSISEPAIYAMLVERVGIYAVADLPFEECSQDNGKLLARNLFGTL